jgi:hypothetical protein
MKDFIFVIALSVKLIPIQTVMDVRKYDGLKLDYRNLLLSLMNLVTTPNRAVFLVLLAFSSPNRKLVVVCAIV